MHYFSYQLYVIRISHHVHCAKLNYYSINLPIFGPGLRMPYWYPFYLKDLRRKWSLGHPLLSSIGLASRATAKSVKNMRTNLNEPLYDLQVLEKRPVSVIDSTRGHDLSNLANVHYTPGPVHEPLPYSPIIDQSPRGLPVHPPQVRQSK